MRSGIGPPARYLLPVDVLGIWSGWESWRDVERFVRGDHAVFDEQ